MKNIKVIDKFKDFTICIMDKKICRIHIDEILELLKRIPGSAYRAEDILSENKNERFMYGKWEHSFIAFEKDKVAGVLIAYERKGEKEGIYDKNSIYINEIAVSSHGTGLGEHMLKTFVRRAHYIYLGGEIIIRIQTEKSKRNEKVVQLYKKVGFCEVGIKSYIVKEDFIMEIKK